MNFICSGKKREKKIPAAVFRSLIFVIEFNLKIHTHQHHLHFVPDTMFLVSIGYHHPVNLFVTVNKNFSFLSLHINQ